MLVIEGHKHLAEVGFACLSARAVANELTQIVVNEVKAALPEAVRTEAPTLARSLLATVHGHCAFDLNGSFALMGQERPVGMALARVRDTLALEDGRGSGG